MIRWLLSCGLVAMVVLALAGAYGVGLLAYERHSGYFAPVWDDGGERVYVIRRETSGLVWGLGWEFFTPPASSFVIADRFELLRLDPETQKSERLVVWRDSPLVGRVTEHYRGRIFNYLRAHLVPEEAGVAVRLSMRIPRVPRSEPWSLEARWPSANEEKANWVPRDAGAMATPDAVLKHGREVLTVPGPEGFNAGVLVVNARGEHDVLARSPAFEARYPKGVPQAVIEENAHRARIQRQREFRAVHAALVDRFMAGGMGEGAARLAAYEEMEEQGYLPRDPEIVATAIEKAPADLAVFEIPERYFEVGLFADIAAALAKPGTGVESDTGTYLRYHDDELGPRLKAFREAGNERFVVRTQDRLYLLEMKRY